MFEFRRATTNFKSVTKLIEMKSLKLTLKKEDPYSGAIAKRKTIFFLLLLFIFFTRQLKSLCFTFGFIPRAEVTREGK